LIHLDEGLSFIETSQHILNGFNLFIQLQKEVYLMVVVFAFKLWHNYGKKEIIQNFGNNSQENESSSLAFQ
jgi:hypothetical protein